MAWTTPKTNWKATVIDGVYTGDFFNAYDYNRIKGNIEYLSTMLEPSFVIQDMGPDKTVRDMIYASEFNCFEENLEQICEACNIRYHDYPVFVANGNTPTFDDLNQIESMILYLYDELSGGAVYAIDTNNDYGVVNGTKAKGKGTNNG